MGDKFQPDEIFISSGSDDKNNLKTFPKLLEDFRHFSGRYLRWNRIIQIGVLEQFEECQHQT